MLKVSQHEAIRWVSLQLSSRRALIKHAPGVGWKIHFMNLNVPRGFCEDFEDRHFFWEEFHVFLLKTFKSWVFEICHECRADACMWCLYTEPRWLELKSTTGRFVLVPDLPGDLAHRASIVCSQDIKIFLLIEHSGKTGYKSVHVSVWAVVCCALDFSFFL